MSKEKEFHLWLNYNDIPDGSPCYVGYVDTKQAVEKGVKVIHSTQVAYVSTDLFEDGYRIFLHLADGVKEVRLGSSDGTDKEIRKAHNLVKLILAGTFGAVE